MKFLMTCVNTAVNWHFMAKGSGIWHLVKFTHTHCLRQHFRLELAVFSANKTPQWVIGQQKVSDMAVYRSVQDRYLSDKCSEATNDEGTIQTLADHVQVHQDALFIFTIARPVHHLHSHRLPGFLVISVVHLTTSAWSQLLLQLHVCGMSLDNLKKKKLNDYLEQSIRRNYAAHHNHIADIEWNYFYDRQLLYKMNEQWLYLV